MAHRARGLERALYRGARGYEIAEALGRQREPDARCVDERVERAAEGEVVPDLPDARDGDPVVERYDEGRHVLEGDAAHARSVEPRPSGHATGRRVETDLVPWGQQAGLERHGDQRDDAVAAHRAPALVVQEEHSEVAVGCNGRCRDRAIHVRVTARLEHEGPAEAVQSFLSEAPLLEDRRAGDRIEALDDDPKRLACGMRLDRLQAPPGRRWAPVGHHPYEGRHMTYST